MAADLEVKSHVVFGGTKILQSSGEGEASKGWGGGKRPPDRGAVGFVLRTGFETSQVGR